MLPVLAALIPLLILPVVLFYFDITPKVVVLLLGAAGVCTLRGTSWPGKRQLLLFGALALPLMLATLASSNPWLSFTGSNWRRYGLVTQLAIFAVALLASKSPMIPTLRAIAVSSILISIYTAIEYLGFDPFQPAAAYHIGEGEWTIVRPPSTLGHANYLGTYLCFSVFLSFALWQNKTIRVWRAIAAIAIATGSVAIILCGSRAALVGGLAGAVVLIVNLRPKARHVIAATALGIVLLTGFYFSPWGAKLRGRARWYREDAMGGARLLMWRDSMRMWLARPLTGWGPETFSTEFPKFQSVDLARSYPDFYHESPHNVLIDELTAKGLLGLAAFALLAAMALRSAKHQLAPALIAGLANLQFTALVVPSAFLFYWLAAVLIDGPEGKKPRFALAITIPFALLFTWFAVRLFAADYALNQTRNFIRRGAAPLAITSYQAVQQWQLPGMNSDLYYSRAIQSITRQQPDLNNAVKAYQEAVQAGVRATQLSEDRHNAWFSLANIYAVMNDMRSTEQSLRAAIQSAPNWYKPHWLLARTLALQGRTSEARTEAQRAIDLGGSKHAEVRDTLRQLGR